MSGCLVRVSGCASEAELKPKCGTHMCRPSVPFRGAHGVIPCLLGDAELMCASFVCLGGRSVRLVSSHLFN
jgi:hypothetical protein